MPKAATHYGTCQGCGRLQKLPNDVLAKHGYEVVSRGFGGYFAGTCRGSSRPTYEESCHWIKNFIIPELEKHLANLRTFQDRLRIASTEPKGYFHEYIRNFGYAWNNVELSIADDGRVTFLNYEKKQEWLHRYSGMPRGDLLSIAAALNIRYADWLETHDIRRSIRALEWQRNRVTKWKYRPHDLIPVPDAKALVKRSNEQFYEREASFLKATGG